MTRSLEDVEAELASVEGVKGQGNKIGKLRKELIEAQRAEIAALRANPIQYNVTMGEGTSAGTYEPVTHSPLDFAPEPAPSSEEWAFIEKVCAELSLDLKTGSSAGIVKGVFNIVDAKVKAWRITRRIFEEIGAGGDWPQYTALGLKATTGAPEHDHSILSDEWIPFYKDEPEAEPEAVEAQPQAVPAQGMPGLPGAEDTATEAEKVRAAMASMIDAQGEPDLELVKSEA